ncbi:L-lysine 2,3-aminomutase [Arboricoccus pini]|uniref:L-lysine 2,3-aminomutase n=1 Tax=Arboricoccus pini TaxID=1963835 RepID=A0A212R2F6_9PROT|nr:lysine-2,3-aminomutase-like protein [Arboricoccus pini]SNB66175.1 L-lysine 2,3-aminomutase [Arboricoccus pini]
MGTKSTIRSPADLEHVGLASPSQSEELAAVAARYAVAITPLMAEAIEQPNDPIGRQFVPRLEELTNRPNESPDPIGDNVHEKVPGIVHRYPDRVLLKLVQVCAVYCRFCFRREVVGPGQPHVMDDQALDRALGYIADDDHIWEVVVTGGDPLIASSRRLAALTERLSAIPHVRIVRFHTRIPLVDPGRITPDLVRSLRADELTSWVVLHVNHARELTSLGKEAIARLVDAGIPMLSQSVLLKGVNDSPAVLGDLMRALVEARIKPYYLHHLDLAPGTGHFRSSVAAGQSIVKALRGRWSGLCQPAYVLDIPGGYGKSPLQPAYADPEEGGYTIEDFEGRRHFYPDDVSDQ